MSERALWKVSTAYTTLFRVVDGANAAVTGLVNANFTKRLYKDGVDQVGVVTATVTEIATGEYKATYTPNAIGYWSLVVIHATYGGAGWQDDIQVTTLDVANGDVNTAQVGGQTASAAAPVAFPAAVGTSTYAGGAVASVAGAVGSVADAGASLTAIGDTRIANLDATVSSRSTYAGGAVASVTGAVGSVTGAVGSVATGGITAASFAADAIAAASLAAAACNKIADHVLRRALADARASSDGDAVAFRSILGAMAKLANKIAISGSTLNIYDETDAGTPVGTQTLTTDADADPITAADTA